MELDSAHVSLLGCLHQIIWIAFEKLRSGVIADCVAAYLLDLLKVGLNQKC